MAEINGAVNADMLRMALRQGHQPILSVTSNSMWPLLRSGDDVVLTPVEVVQLDAGDIITMLCNGHLLTHRYWGVVEAAGEPCLRTRGDRPLRFDPPIPSADLIGRVSERRRNGRRLALHRGPGERGNRALARLAHQEWRWFGAHTGHDRAELLPMWARVCRRLLLVFITILDTIVTRIVSESN